MVTYQDLLQQCKREPHEFLYLLLNPLVAIDPEEKLHIEQLRSKFSITVVPRADFAHTPEQCPQLLTLALPVQDADVDLLDKALDWALGELGYDRRYVCGWLISDEGPMDVAQMIADHCIVRDSDKALQRNLLPLFEPLRIELMQGASDAGWLDGWLGCVSSWIYVTANGELASLRRKAAKPWDNALPESISRAQFHARAVGSLLLAWQRTQAMLPSNAARLALEQIRTAHLLGLFGLEDQLVFGLNRLTIHPKYERHPAVLSAIQQAALGKTPLAVGFEKIDDLVWDEIADMSR